MMRGWAASKRIPTPGSRTGKSTGRPRTRRDATSRTTERRSEPPAIRVAMCETAAECHACEDLQTAVWGGSEREIVPYDILRAIAHAGGTLIGAWDCERIVGMALS